ncbi:hypothetical protein EUTSA_v10026983mg [Eutrema salsugineum]|uniref:Neprosin PEP catalytic domain-containing protein n=1 Tax=Eutrema salsugineum TaxID=72664 RepID=V4MKP1_EUTSA|nr:uncharacterized protein LOC18028305 [Eutrema salsugineum]ESQ56057.1 hypothetical protein EUTSA_v10026983mg [Eutrema salsugineum]
MEVKGPVTWVLLMCYIFGHIITSHNKGFIEAKSLSKFEDLEIQRKLKTINKPAVKIIKTIDGERYGCVDFFKQPGFDHPSMKNHTYHYKMQRMWHPEGMRKSKTNNTGFGYLWENGVGCPIGTVPIRRVTKNDLLSLNSLGDNYKPRGSWNTTSYDPNNADQYKLHHFAVGRTTNTGMMFNGATMELCVTAPTVNPNQFSASRLHFQMGDDYIQLGLTVNPALYRDDQPRVFVYTKAGGKACYNSHCDVGMISVRHDFPMGMLVTPVSIRGAKHSHYVTFGLIKDKANGKRWLEFGDNAVEIGFWPSQKFRQSHGNKVEWGGEVYSPSPPSPPMGYGIFPFDHMRYDAYVKRISILDGNFKFDDKVDYMESFSDNNRGYKVLDELNSGFPEAGHIIFYGGPGGI